MGYLLPQYSLKVVSHNNSFLQDCYYHIVISCHVQYYDVRKKQHFHAAGAHNILACFVVHWS